MLRDDILWSLAGNLRMEGIGEVSIYQAEIEGIPLELHKARFYYEGKLWEVEGRYYTSCQANIWPAIQAAPQGEVVSLIPLLPAENLIEKEEAGTFYAVI